MKFSVKDFFGFNLTVMRILGFYPPQKYKKSYKVFANFVYIFCTVSVPTLIGVHLLIDEEVDVVQVSDNSFLMLQVGCFIFKMLPFIHCGDKIRKTIYDIEHPVFMSYTETQEVLVKRCIKTCHGITFLFFGFCVLSWILFITVPLFADTRKFPVEIWLPYDATAQTYLYVSAYIFICLGIGNGACSNGVVDPLVAGLACYATTQLKILQDTLKNIEENANNIMLHTVKTNSIEINAQEEARLKNKLIYGKIKQCIIHHNAIFEFVQKYEIIYSPVVFTQFTASILVICLSCWQLSMIEPFTYKFFFMTSFLITMIQEIFLYSYFGSTLSEESAGITTAIYLSNWYNYDIKCKKALITLMQRSQRPMVVTAGKILDLSLFTFTTILRRAYSLLAVLKNYQ